MIAALATGLALTFAGGSQGSAIAELERAVAPERALARRADVTIGRSSQGRPIDATAANGLGLPADAASQGGPLVLAFGCIHGDECAGARVVRRAWRGCPPPGSGLITVPNLNPDGRAEGTRLNGRGVDLNRNFASEWRSIGSRGDPEYSGPKPFSEPEAKLARELIRRLRPDVTIWFHQQAEPLVRAWGPSVPAAKVYARLSGLAFARMPWMDGTAPNWQNHAFPGTASFVVELPASGEFDADRQALALFRLVGELIDNREPGR